MHKEEIKQSHDQWIFIGFLVLVAWVPLPLGSNRPWAWSLMEVGIYSLTLVWIVQWLRNKVDISKAFIRARLVLYCMFAWLCWIALQTVPLPLSLLEWLSPRAAYHYGLAANNPDQWFPLSVEVYATRQGWLKSFAYVQFFCLALLLINTHKRVEQFLAIIILGGFFQATYGSLMTLSGMEYGFFMKKEFGEGVATGTFTNRNHLAGYLEMSLAAGIGTMIGLLSPSGSNSWRERIRKIFLLFLSAKLRLRLYLVVMVIALVLTHSRMGNTAFFASLLITGVISLLLSKQAKRPAIIFIASLIVIDIFIVGTWYGIEKVVDRIEQTTIEAEYRDDTYGHIWQQWQDYKLTGSGLGSFYAVFPAYKTRIEAEGFYRHAHNDYLEFGSESGMIGIFLLASMVLSSMFAAIAALYKRKDEIMRGLAFSSIMGITAILIHSTVDFNLQIPANAILFILLMALAWISLTLKKQRNKESIDPYS